VRRRANVWAAKGDIAGKNKADRPRQVFLQLGTTMRVGLESRGKRRFDFRLQHRAKDPLGTGRDGRWFRRSCLCAMP